MSGLDHGLMERALNAVALRVVAGRRLAPGDVLEDVLPGAPVVVERVADVALSETVSWSGWFHRRQPEALAIVWPTETGIFGWQPGAPEFLDQLQPRGWRAPFEHGGGLAVDPPWPFPVPPDHRVFTCTHVLNGHRAILWAVRQSDGVYGEDWTINCGDYPHDLSEMAVVHLAHLVRAAPSLRDLSDLALDEEALRHNPDSGWGRGRLV